MLDSLLTGVSLSDFTNCTRVEISGLSAWFWRLGLLPTTLHMLEIGTSGMSSTGQERFMVAATQPCTCRVQERAAVLSKFFPANASSKQLAKHDIQRVHVAEKLKQYNCLGICSMGLICSVFHALKSVRYQDSQPSQTALCLKCWPNAWGKEQEHLLQLPQNLIMPLLKLSLKMKGVSEICEDRFRIDLRWLNKQTSAPGYHYILKQGAAHQRVPTALLCNFRNFQP